MSLNLSTVPVEPGQIATREQILAAAGEIFAAVGFRAAKVRDICQRAGVNSAAINYHFGDKETLYREVLRYSQRLGLEKYPPMMGVSPTAPPEEKLHGFILAFLRRIFEDGPIAWYGKIMSREMIEPSMALDIVIQEKIHPMAAQLWAVTGEILHLPMEHETVRLCSFSIVSQCVFYHHCRPLLNRMFPEMPPMHAARTAQLAAHITRFSLAALNEHAIKPD